MAYSCIVSYDETQIRRDQNLMTIVCSDNAEMDKLREIEKLLKSGANANFVDANRGNCTPLHFAVNKQEINIIKCLLHHGGNAEIENTFNLTAYEIAKILKNWKIIQLLKPQNLLTGSVGFNQLLTADWNEKVNKLLEIFVKSFVERYLEKLKDFEDEAKPGNATEKSGKTVELSKKVAKVCYIIPKVGRVAVSGVEAVVDRVAHRMHRTGAIKVHEEFINFGGPLDVQDELLKILAEAGFDIFKSFEYQFARCTSVTGSAERGMEKLADDAMNRSISYIKINKQQIELTSSFITKSVIYGESKGIRKTGHTVQSDSLDIQYNHDKNWQVADLYRKVGLLMNNNGDVMYYVRKDVSGANKFGFRLPFDWELKDWEEHLKQTYKMTNKHTDQKLNEYIVASLNAMDQKKKIKNILEAINKSNPLKLAMITNEGVERIENEVKEVKEVLVIGNTNIDKLREGQAVVQDNLTNIIEKQHEIFSAVTSDDGTTMWENLKESAECIVSNSDTACEFANEMQQAFSLLYDMVKKLRFKKIEDGMYDVKCFLKKGNEVFDKLEKREIDFPEALDYMVGKVVDIESAVALCKQSMPNCNNSIWTELWSDLRQYFKLATGSERLDELFVDAHEFFCTVSQLLGYVKLKKLETGVIQICQYVKTGQEIFDKIGELQTILRQTINKILECSQGGAAIQELNSDGHEVDTSLLDVRRVVDLIMPNSAEVSDEVVNALQICFDTAFSLYKQFD